MTSIRCISTIPFADNYISDSNIIRPTNESITNACQQAIQEYRDEMTHRDGLGDDEFPPPPALMRSSNSATIAGSRDALDEDGALPYIFMDILYSHFDNDKGEDMSVIYGNLMFKNDDEYWNIEFTTEGVTAVSKLLQEYF
jgi:hypothetical protein